MLKKVLPFVVLLCFVLASVAFAVEPAQYYAKENLKTWDRDKVAGGEGTLFGKFAWTRNDAPKDFACKEIGWMTLLPGASIGMHKHEINEDAYIIVSGEGMFVDSDGTKTNVKAGDVTIARKGQSHALYNTGKEPLIFLDVIAQQ